MVGRETWDDTASSCFAAFATTAPGTLPTCGTFHASHLPSPPLSYLYILPATTCCCKPSPYSPAAACLLPGLFCFFFPIPLVVLNWAPPSAFLLPGLYACFFCCMPSRYLVHFWHFCALYYSSQLPFTNLYACRSISTHLLPVDHVYLFSLETGMGMGGQTCFACHLPKTVSASTKPALPTVLAWLSLATLPTHTLPLPHLHLHTISLLLPSPPRPSVTLLYRLATCPKHCVALHWMWFFFSPSLQVQA